MIQWLTGGTKTGIFQYDTFGKKYYFNLDISGWDVSNVKDMREMFLETNNFNQDISDWDVSNVTSMTAMFKGYKAAFNQPLNDWDVSNVTSMSEMFKGYEAEFNQPLDKWDVSNVTNMGSMFSMSKFNQNISNWVINKCIYGLYVSGNSAMLEKYKPSKNKEL